MLPVAASTAKFEKRLSGKRNGSSKEGKREVRRAHCFFAQLALALLTATSSSSSSFLDHENSEPLSYTTPLSLFQTPLPLSAKHSRNAVDDRHTFPVRPPPPLRLSFLSSSSSSYLIVITILVNPDKARPLAHRPDGVPAILPRAHLAGDFEPRGEGDEALVVVPG